MQSKRLYYHQPIERQVPGVPSPVAVAVQFALYPMKQEQDAIRKDFRIGLSLYQNARKLFVNRAERRRQKAKRTRTDLPEEYDGSRLYLWELTMQGTVFPKYLRILQAAEYVAESRQALMWFADLMQQAGDRMRHQVKPSHDVFLVLYAGVLGRAIDEVGIDVAREIAQQYVKLGTMTNGYEFVSAMVNATMNVFLEIQNGGSDESVDD